MKYPYAERAGLMESSAIREILKVTREPDMISFAGGLPAPELFPLEGIVKIIFIFLSFPSISSSSVGTHQQIY